MEKLYYSIGEVAEALGESVVTVRFWSDSFPSFIKPKRNAKGNRMFSKEDVETFRQIQYLVKVQRLTLEGAAKRMRDEGRKVAAEAKVLETLKALREQLSEVRRSMDRGD